MTMEHLQPYLSWLEVRVAEARALPADTLLLFLAGAALIISILSSAWRKAAGRARGLRRDLAALEAEFASSRSMLEDEIKWRLSAERRTAQVPKPVDMRANPQP